MTDTEQQFEMAGLTRQHLWNEPAVKLISRGEPFRRWLGLLHELADECKLHFDADGVHVRLVDTANVGSVQLDWSPPGMNVYNFNGDGEILLGENLDTLEDFASFARIPQNDPLSVHIAPRKEGESIEEGVYHHLGCRVTRPDQRVQRSTVLPTIDPDSIRQEPDHELKPGSQTCEAEVNIAGFSAALKAMKKLSDRTVISVNGETLVMQPETDVGSDTFNFPDTVTRKEGDAASLFSLNYLAGMAQRVKVLGVETVTLRLGDEYPVSLLFEHEEWGLKGGYILAPRIPDD